MKYFYKSGDRIKDKKIKVIEIVHLTCTCKVTRFLLALNITFLILFVGLEFMDINNINFFTLIIIILIYFFNIGLQFYVSYNKLKVQKSVEAFKVVHLCNFCEFEKSNFCGDKCELYPEE